MRTSGQFLLLHRSTIGPGGCRKVTEACRSGRELVVLLSANPFCLSVEAWANCFSSGRFSSMYCCFSPSSSFTCQRSSFSTFFSKQHWVSSFSSSSQLLGLHSPVRRSTRRSSLKAGHYQYLQSCESADIRALRSGSCLSNFCSGRKIRSFCSSSRHSGASAAEAPVYSPRNSSSSSSLVGFENEAPEYPALSSPTSVYVHLPFCRRRCFYCDFPIVAVGERTEKTKGHIDLTMSNYVDLVCKEIAATAKKSSLKGGLSTLKTVFFGGGTPSLLPVPLLTRIIKELKCHFQVASDAEISMEMDPGTFDSEKLAGFLGSGITRVSLGVQSFQAELLQACGRAHGLPEVYDAVEAIHSNGLKNWSLDLMASLPNQSLQQWEHSLKEAVSLNPAHVSVYDLQIEEGTLFNRWFKAGQEPLPSDEVSAELYCMASRKLREEGFEHYEVSNYARPGFQCRHNLVYWENRPYYAFGLGSTSYIEGRRFSRPRKFKEYANYVQILEATGSTTDYDDLPQFSLEDQVLNTVMLSLRLARGLNLTEFEVRFGAPLTSTVCKGLVPFVEKGLVEAIDVQRQTIPSSTYIQNWTEGKIGFGKFFETVDTKEFTRSDGSLVEPSIKENVRVPTFEIPGNLRNDTSERGAVFVRLTDPEGFLLSNTVIASIFAALPSEGSH